MADAAAKATRLLPTHAVLLATLVLLCGPVLIDLSAGPRTRPFGYVAADAFYYLAVARNLARHGAPTFDGETLVNGFHPLWQAATGAAYLAMDAVGAARHVVLGVVLLSLAFVAGGLCFLARALANEERPLTPAFLVLPVGVYGLLAAPAWLSCFGALAAQSELEGPLPLYGTLWSFVNGMESGAVLFFFGAAAFLHARTPWTQSPRAAALLGVTLSAFVLARLDHGVIAVPLVVALLLRAGRSRRACAVRLAGWFVGPIAVYLAVNLLAFGSPVPVSGLAKSTFPVPNGENARMLRELLAGPGAPGFLNLAWRALQLLVPSATAGLYLLARGRRSDRPFEAFLAPVAVGVLALAAYDFAFVPPYKQGHWYFPVSCLFVSLVVLAWLDRAPGRWPLRWALPASAGWLALSLAMFAFLQRQPEHHARYASFYWYEAPRVRAAFGADPPRLLEVDDGIVGFSLDVPAMSSELLLDPEAARARGERRLYPLAYARGFDSVTTLVYVGAAGFLRDRSPEAAAAWARRLLGGQGLEDFRFSLRFVSPSGSFAIVRGERR